MTDVDRLLAIEGIRKAKATYWYAMDTKNWDLMRSAFTANALADYRGGRDFTLQPDIAAAERALAQGHPAVIRGRDDIVSWNSRAVARWITIHHGHAPIIEITGPETGTAIWPIFDYTDDGQNALKSYGHYHDTYRVEDGEWRIDTLCYIRKRVDGNLPPLPAQASPA